MMPQKMPLGPEVLRTMAEDERDQVLLDLYGRNEIVNESPAFNQDAMERLEYELGCIPEPEKEEFELAQLHCPDYVNSNGFRLMFLRSTKFDPKAAAKKIVQYWTLKVEVFGQDRAFRKLSLRDFQEEDQTALELGGIRLLPGHDQAGRGIILSCRHLYQNKRSHKKNMLRLMWYIVHVAMEDEDVQKKGVIVIFTNFMAPRTMPAMDTKLNRIAWRHALGGLPFRIQGLHQVVASDNKNSFETIMAESVLHLDKRTRGLYIEHNISIQNTAAELEAYGISGDDLPEDLGGNLDFDYHEWLEGRRRKEVMPTL